MFVRNRIFVFPAHPLLEKPKERSMVLCPAESEGAEKALVTPMFTAGILQPTKHEPSLPIL